MNRKKEIIDSITRISGRYSPYEVFNDWIRCMALSISNGSTLIQDKIWEGREAEYLNTMQKYNKTEQIALCEMMAYLVETLEDGPDDVLGDIYMRSGMGSKITGQFFTPFHLSVLAATMSLADSIKSFNGEMTTLNEPSCGGGGMIIAAAKVLHDAGIDYQKYMRVVAQDLDWKGVYMCYVQLSLLGIDGICVQGDTLADPYIPGRTDPEHILITPARAGMLI